MSALSKSILVAIFICLLALYGSAPLFLPAPEAASAPAYQFSAERAMSHLNTLAAIKRVAGSPGMEETANYLIAVLSGISLEPEVQESVTSTGRLRNVVVRIPGRDSDQALLILTHLDSISYGAGDNASGVAVLLEVARSLLADVQPKHDIILLFDDGEEQGYRGGYAFAGSHRWMSKVRSVIGLDTAAWGPVILLQTTPGNEKWISAYSRSVQNPTAFGFFANSDWNISKDTSEIQPFFEQGLPGMALEDPTAFQGKHSNLDTVEHIRPGSLQQMGEQTLSLARFISDTDVGLASTRDHSYFTLWKIGVWHYPASWNIAWMILSVVGMVAILVRGLRQRIYSIGTLLLAGLSYLLIYVGIALLGVVFGKWFESLYPNTNPYIESYLNAASLPFFLMVILVVVVVYFIVRTKIVHSLGNIIVMQTGLLFWVLFALISTVFLQAGSYVFTIPLIGFILAGFLPFRLKFLKIVPTAFSIILITPNIVLAFLGTGFQTLALVTILIALNMELWISAIP